MIVSWVPCHVSCVKCHMSHIMCFVLHVTCHLSPVTKPPTMHSRVVPKDPEPQQIQNPQIIKTAEKNIFRYANISKTLIDQTQNIWP